MATQKYNNQYQNNHNNSDFNYKINQYSQSTPLSNSNNIQRETNQTNKNLILLNIII